VFAKLAALSHRTRTGVRELFSSDKYLNRVIFFSANDGVHSGAVIGGSDAFYGTLREVFHATLIRFFSGGGADVLKGQEMSERGIGRHEEIVLELKVAVGKRPFRTWAHSVVFTVAQHDIESFLPIRKNGRRTIGLQFSPG
jgi:hypothetical protein